MFFTSLGADARCSIVPREYLFFVCVNRNQPVATRNESMHSAICGNTCSLMCIFVCVLHVTRHLYPLVLSAAVTVRGRVQAVMINLMLSVSSVSPNETLAVGN